MANKINEIKLLAALKDEEKKLIDANSKDVTSAGYHKAEGFSLAVDYIQYLVKSGQLE